MASLRGKSTIAVLLPAVLILFMAVEARAGEVTLRRFAFVVGANDGGRGRVRLRYAHSDARAVARVLQQLGGVGSKDVVLLINPRIAILRAALNGMHALLQKAKRDGLRLELVFYYSGHSDTTGLLLSGKRLPYKELRRIINGFPADVRIGVLDSCASGALTRGKGGVRRPAFMMDKSTNVRGYAYLTSASANETAQESDKLRGSFFTHYLISGLRGAADANRDKRVTLNEAYQYAFHQTLARTESTRTGPQHANYAMQLAGSGDLVITDLRRTAARLVLEPALIGRVFIRDGKGRLMAEVVKKTRRPMVLGLPPGRYKITLEYRKQIRRGSVTLNRTMKTVLRIDNMKVTVSRERAVTKGTPAVTRKAKARPRVVRPFRFGFFGLGSIGRRRLELNYFALNFGFGRGNFLKGFELSVGGSWWTHDVSGIQISVAMHYVGGDFRGLQATAGANLVLGNLYGVQLSAGFNQARSMYGMQVTAGANHALGPAKGFQASAGYNLAGSLVGFQAAAGGNVTLGRLWGFQASAGYNQAGSLTGFQVTAGANVVPGVVRGFQGSAGYNHAGSLRGWQATAGVNLVPRDARGIQISAGYNHAGSLNGLQVTAGANAAVGSMKGMQVGTVNYAGKARGIQIGVINIAGEDDGLVPIGLINYAGNGLLEPTFWSTGTSYMNAGLKMGSRHVYGLLGAGVHPGEDKDERISVLAGMGVHTDLTHRFYLDIDAVHHFLLQGYKWHDKTDMIAKFRPAFGVRLLDQLSLYAGPTLDLLISRMRQDLGPAALSLWKREGGKTRVQLGLSFLVGIQWEPRIGRHNSRSRRRPAPAPAPPPPAYTASTSP